MKSLRPTRRLALAGLAALPAILAGIGHAAEPYPSRPVTLYVSFGPGGTGDITARIVSREMTRTMRQAVVVDNRPVPNVADSLVAKSKPDGYSMIAIGGGSALNAALFKSLPYDPVKDLAHLSTISSFSLALVTAGDSAFTNVRDVVAWAKANPGKLNIGTARLGSTQNLTADLFKSATGIEAVIIPYRTTADLVTALRSHDVQVAIESVPAILGQFTAKTVKPLAITAATRFHGLPEVPTMAETLPGFEATGWTGFAVPAGTPPEIVAYLNRQIVDAVNTPAVRQALEEVGMVAGASSAQEMTRRMQDDIAKWRAVIDKAGIPRQ